MVYFNLLSCSDISGGGKFRSSHFNVWVYKSDYYQSRMTFVNSHQSPGPFFDMKDVSLLFHYDRG